MLSHGRAWEKLGVHEPFLYFPGMAPPKGKKQHRDAVFRDFLVKLMGLEYVNSLTAYDYGIPREDSAYISVLKYRTPISSLDWRITPYCLGWMKRHFISMNGVSPNWDWDYIVAGMNKGSSPGFPYNRKTSYCQGFKTKREMFAYENGNFARKEFDKYVEEMSIYPTKVVEFYSLSAKAEMRKVTKIESNSFRTYTAASWRNTALGIAIFGPMLDIFYKDRSTWSFVGGSTFYGRWEELYRKLSYFEKGFECDESNYDSSLPEELISNVRDMFLEFLNDKSVRCRNMVRNLFDFIREGIVVCPNGDLFFKKQGNPSGSFLTIVLNTLVLYQLFVYAWIRLAPEGYRTYEAFDELIRCALCGDDNLWSVHPDIVSWFNVDAVGAVWSAIGVEVNPTKVAKGFISDLRFLSHGFRDVCGKIVPIPDVEKAISSMICHSMAYKSIKWSFLKASALLINTFWTDLGRKVFRDYQHFLVDNYKTELESEPSMKDDDILHWKDLKTLLRTDQEIAMMYSRREGVVHQILEAPRKLLTEFEFELQSMPKSAAAKARYRKKKAAVNKARGLPAKTRLRIGRRVQSRIVNGRVVERDMSNAFALMRGGRVRRNTVQRLAGIESKRVRVPIATGTSGRQRGPVLSNGGEFRVRHREYLQDLVTAVNGNLNTIFYAIQPGLAQYFPWLSQLAQNFQYYRINSLSFEFESTAPSTASGQLVMLINYDSRDDTQVNVQQYMNFKGAVDTVVWKSIRLPFVKPSEAKSRYYIRNGAQPTGTDIREYDVANFNLAIFNSSIVNAQVGRLLVSYDISLIFPRTTVTPLTMSLVASTQSAGGQVFTASAPFNAALLTPGTVSGSYQFINTGYFDTKNQGDGRNVVPSWPYVGGNTVYCNGGDWCITALWEDLAGGSLGWTPSSSPYPFHIVPVNGTVGVASTFQGAYRITNNNEFFCTQVFSAPSGEWAITMPITSGNFSYFILNITLTPVNNLGPSYITWSNALKMRGPRVEEKEGKRVDSPVLVSLPAQSSRAPSKKSDKKTS